MSTELAFRAGSFVAILIIMGMAETLWPVAERVDAGGDRLWRHRAADRGHGSGIGHARHLS